MNWYYSIRGGHTHVRVFMNGAKCGDLCFRNEEFVSIRKGAIGIENCHEEDPADAPQRETIQAIYISKKGYNEIIGSLMSLIESSNSEDKPVTDGQLETTRVMLKECGI